MESLCKSCKKNKCNKTIVIMEYINLAVFKCLDYEKDKKKIYGYVEKKNITANRQKTVMGLYSPDWS